MAQFAIVSAVASQRAVPEFNFFLCGVFMVSLCLWEFSPGAPGSSKLAIGVNAMCEWLSLIALLSYCPHFDYKTEFVTNKGPVY